jgi:hypothetical protein
MRRNKWAIIFSLLLVPAAAAVVILDLAGVFGYSDLPFLLVFFPYFLFMFIQRTGSRCTFAVALCMLLYMGLSYVPTGAGPITERFGEWFYVFFVFGLIQYSREAWQGK